MPTTWLLNANSTPIASASVLRDRTKAGASMTETVGMIMPQQARRFGSHSRSRDGATKRMPVFVFQALNHSRRSDDASRQSPRRTSSHAMAMIIPVLSSGIPRSDAYETANALPSLARRPLSDKGCSWMPLWSTPLFLALVSSPAPACCSRTMMRGGLTQRLRASSRAHAQPTTPPPTMQMSYECMVSLRGRTAIKLRATPHLQRASARLSPSARGSEQDQATRPEDSYARSC